jgi:hypothetical protein
MQIFNSGIMFVSIHARAGTEMNDADQWAIELGQNMKTKQGEIRQREETVAMKREIIAEKLPGIWGDLMKSFQSYCEAHNRNNNPPRPLACFWMGADEFWVRPDALPEVVKVNYNRMTSEIAVKTPSGTEWYVPKAVMRGQGEVELMTRATQRVISLSGIAKEALTDAIENGRTDY